MPSPLSRLEAAVAQLTRTVDILERQQQQEEEGEHEQRPRPAELVAPAAH
jgi:hypothetical protein